MTISETIKFLQKETQESTEMLTKNIWINPVTYISICADILVEESEAFDNNEPTMNVPYNKHRTEQAEQSIFILSDIKQGRLTAPTKIAI